MTSRAPDLQEGPSSDAARVLRERAEKTLGERTARLPFDAEASSPGEAKRLLHELQVHHIELEMQNEELRRLQVDLDASRAQYFDLYELAPVGYVMLDQSGLVQRANLTICTLLGVARGSLLQHPFSRFLAPQDADAFYLLSRRLLVGGGERSLDVRVVKDGGGEFWAHLVATARDESGARLVGVVLSDITQSKQAEAALRYSEERLRGVVDSALDGVITTSATGHITEWNPQAQAMFGWTREEALGQLLTRLIISERFRAAHEHGLPLGAPGAERKLHHRSELTALRKGGQEFPVEISLSRAQAGGSVVYSAFVRDLTERQQADAAKAQLEGQLQQAQKLASVGRLAGGVAHDFNNMLTVIIGHSESALDALASSAPASVIQPDLEEIRHAAQRSADLTRQLLAFARKQPIVPQVVDLNERVESTLKLLRRLLGEDLQLSWKGAPGLWPITMDPTQLDQILTNLCVNARDAIVDVGTVTVETANIFITREYCVDHLAAVPGDFVRLKVSDTGAGMDQATLRLIFEPFFTTKGVGKGTGLGLATVYGAVTENGGFLEVSSEVGRGSTFLVYLPRYASVAEPARVEAVVAGPGAKETILLVEDEPAILRIATRLLEAQGYSVLGAGGPEEALLLSAQHRGPLELLITDVIMPGMNGRDLAVRLLALRPGLKRLFMSGYTADVAGVREDAEHFIQKPFSRTGLAAKVRAVLDGP